MNMVVLQDVTRSVSHSVNQSPWQSVQQCFILFWPANIILHIKYFFWHIIYFYSVPILENRCFICFCVCFSICLLAFLQFFFFIYFAAINIMHLLYFFSSPNAWFFCPTISLFLKYLGKHINGAVNYENASIS